MFGLFISKAYADTLPVQGSDVAVQWDNLYSFLVWLSVFFFVLVIGAMILFTIKYRASVHKKTKYITGSHALEIFWAAVPTILLLIIFGWGYQVYHTMTSAPADAYEIRVIGKQWLWQFQYDDGRSTIGELYVPVNRPVKLIMTSEDVIHSFAIPNFRVKQDVVPGMYTSVWFEAKLPGRHQVYCTEYCGTSHSGMLAQVFALEDDQWSAWRRGKKVGPIPIAGRELTEADTKAMEQSQQTQVVSLADQGKTLMTSKGCVACHSEDGSVKVGPTYKGLFGAKREFVDGSTATADENYIRESIENPQAKLVKGFGPLMPTFKGLVTEEEMNALIAYIKGLK